MAYDEGLAHRIREVLDNSASRRLRQQAGLGERKMFGGLAFLLNGNMCCGVVGDELMVRVGPEQYGAALSQPHARELDFTGRPMTGMVMVAVEGLASDESLAAWVAQGVAYAASLPAK